MDKEELQGIAFKIIMDAGHSRHLIQDALRLMKSGKFEDAEEKLEEAKQAMIAGHNAQTTILTTYAKGEDVFIDFMMVHAQDHLMSSMTLHDVAGELLNIYRRID